MCSPAGPDEHRPHRFYLYLQGIDRKYRYLRKLSRHSVSNASDTSQLS